MPRSPRDAGAAHAARALHIAAFCRDAVQLQAAPTLSEMPRLAQSVVSADDGAGDTPIRWRARGSMLPVAGGAAQCLVELEIEATPTLECQRCLQPVTLTLRIDRRFRFVEGEDEAARLDEELEDDVLALEPRFDLPALVEDELLLALPLVPRHDTCPELPAALQPGTAGEGQSGAREEDQPEHPFAALAALRGRPKG